MNVTPAVDGRANRGDRVVVRDAAPHRRAQAPRAEADLRDLDSRSPQRRVFMALARSPASCSCRNSATRAPTASSSSTAL